MTDLLTASLRCRNGKLKRYLAWQPRFRTFRDGFALREELPRSGSKIPWEERA